MHFCEISVILLKTNGVFIVTIGERIKKRRSELGLTVDDLAEKLGKNRATIYRYESNDIEKLPITVLQPLAKVLNVTPAFLMGWTDIVDKSNNSHIELSAQEQKILHLFSLLTDSQKDNLIGRAELFIEQNEQEKKQEQTNNNKTRWVYKAARSTDGEKAGYVEMSEEEIQRILNAPEADDF